MNVDEVFSLYINKEIFLSDIKNKFNIYLENKKYKQIMKKIKKFYKNNNKRKKYKKQNYNNINNNIETEKKGRKKRKMKKKVKNFKEKKLKKKTIENIIKKEESKNYLDNNKLLIKKYDDNFISKGLENIGNTCYLNSGLQLLINIIPIRIYILGNFYIEDINTENPLSSFGQIANEFAKLLNYIKNSKQNYIDPIELCFKIKENSPIFDMYSQKDSIEFLTYFIDILHEDLNKIKKKPNINFNEYYKRKCFDDLKTEFDFVNKFYALKNQSFINDILYGYLLFTFTCKICNKTTYNFDRFSMISIPVEKNLHDCLKKFEEPFLMEDSNQIYCYQCKKDTDCIKKCKIFNIPYYLIIHFQRTVKLVKSDNFIDIPFSFDFKEFCENKNFDDLNYELIATINHYGRTSRSGHYLAYCKNYYNQKWYSFNDSMVSEIDEKNVINNQTIIVLYQKKDILNNVDFEDLIKKKIIDYTQDDLIKKYLKD